MLRESLVPNMQRNTEPLSINRCSELSAKNIPVILLMGMFFFSVANATDLKLAKQLYQEESWAACLVECRRLGDSGQGSPLSEARLLQAICRIRLDKDAPDALLQDLAPLAAQTHSQEVSAVASFEMGRIFWKESRHRQAFSSFVRSFETTTNEALFLIAACSSFLVMEEEPSLKAEYPHIAQQINTSRTLWTGQIFAESRINHSHGSIGQFVGNNIITFYRSQISPAIGQRCTLEPSCSEYFKQASCQHGLLGVPMVADRFFREPSVNSERKNPIFKRGMIRYSDPLYNHDFWMKDE